jgi:hypothetical protein
MAPYLQDLIVTRLAATGAAQQLWSLLVLAALEGPDALTAFLDGTHTVSRPEPPAATQASKAKAERPGYYVGAITVEGFRGVGPSATLPLHPGPGLTLVVGRNGSGKSSFAEGLELLLTGRNMRWEGRSKAWGLGWRNLHQAATAAISADLLVEGQGPLTVSRTWAAGAELAASVASARAKGKAATPLDAVGWANALATFRPFLSYNELGSMLDEGPSKLYDALSTVLGLDELVTVQARLADARKARQALVESAKTGAKLLAAEAETVGANTGEPRAVHLAAKLKAKTWDLPALHALAAGGADATREKLDGLTRLAALVPVSVESAQAAVNRLRVAADRLAGLQGTDAARSLARARLLEQALAFHTAHLSTAAHGAKHDTGTACPVCGAAHGLDGDWHTRSTLEVTALKAEASAVQGAESEAAGALRDARSLIRECGVLPSSIAGELPSLQRLRDADAQWVTGRSLDQPAALADHLETHVLDLAEATTRVALEAAAELKRREDVWRPLALALALWLPLAEQSARAKEHVDQLKLAEQWWKDAVEAIRDERFAPIADRAMATWRQLRLQSNVDLGGVELAGTSTSRRVTLKVTVDGAPAEALGVMSQGELHSLALSLFLPRATLPDSPFRFICVDDPVQSMDPARVEGLARVLADTAKTRQVIVFSHDDRLSEAVRRLGLPARILSVTRRAQSVVDVAVARDPISGYLDDAGALLKTENLPRDVAARVIPGFCRLALEAACTTTVRQRRLGKGELHQSVEDLLDEHGKLYPLMALVLFDDEKRQGDVLARLGKTGAWAVDAFKGCNRGAHELHDGDLKELVNGSRELAKKIAEMA